MKDFKIVLTGSSYTVTPQNTRALCWMIARTTTAQRPQHTVAVLDSDSLAVFCSDAVVSQLTYDIDTDWLHLAQEICLPQINHITLIPGQPVMARFSGPHAAQVVDAFQTDTIPAPYDSREPRPDILAAIQRLNPGAVVEWEPAQPKLDIHHEMRHLLYER